MKLFVLSSTVAVLFLYGCTTRPTRPWIVKKISPFESLHYSEYFDVKKKVADDGVLVHLIVTLGKERLPEQYYIQDGLATDGRLTEREYRDGIYEGVSEVYFTNLSDSPVILSDVSISTDAYALQNVLSEPITLQPKQHFKTRPLVDSRSLYVTTCPFRLDCNVNGEKVTLNTTAERVLVENISKH